MSDEKVKTQERTKDLVLSPSKSLPDSTPTVVGYDWNSGVDYNKLLQNYKRCGFQATNFGLAVEEIKRMIECRNIPLPADKLDMSEKDEFIRRKNNCTIFLGYTSNMVSCGIRETIRFLVQHKMVDCLVSTTGGIEEDFMKCLAPTYVGSFDLDDRNLRKGYINRIANLLLPNSNYCKLEEWIMPILDEMLQEQKEKNVVWTPSKVITRLGEKIDNPESIYYWAAKNKIPVFCPALTDGSMGDMFYFHSFKNPGLKLDIIGDIQRIHNLTVKAENTGIIIVGGGIIKHHICNTNSMRNGADFAIYLNTASEFDGSDTGAKPEEAKSWGKISKDAKPVKIYAEATLVFPLLVGETFAKEFHKKKEYRK